MRITQGIIFRDFTRNLDRVTDKLYDSFQEISSGKRLRHPSDDSIAVSRALRAKDNLASNGQYKKNIELTLNWLKTTESALNSAEDILKRLEEIAISMGSDNTFTDARQVAADEVARLKEQTLTIANTKLGNRYIFAGYITDNPPFVDSDNSYHGDNNEIKAKIGHSIEYPYSIPGSIFTNDVNVFQLMDDLKTDLEANDTDRIRSHLDEINQAFDQINWAYTKIGSRINLLDDVKQDISDEELRLEDIVSKQEDSDLSQAAPRLYAYQASYQAILASFVKTTSVNLFSLLA